jgi:uncharacterized protein
MELITALLFVAFGLIVGLLSGLVGIGGGVLIVPFLYFFYDHAEIFGVFVDPGSRVVLAHGTSLFVIMPTSVRGAIAYNRSGLVEWRAVWPIGLVSILSAVLGARLALVLPDGILKAGFGLLLVYSGVRLVQRRARSSDGSPRRPRLSLPYTLPTGIVVGFFSALLGVGGGIVAIPLLMSLIRLEMRKVAATSIGIIAITAAAGSLAYMWSGLGEPGLPRWSLGYVHLSAGLAMFAGSALSVGWGAKLNQRMKPRTLLLLFAMLFFTIGLRLVWTNFEHLGILLF